MGLRSIGNLSGRGLLDYRRKNFDQLGPLGDEILTFVPFFERIRLGDQPQPIDTFLRFSETDLYPHQEVFFAQGLVGFPVVGADGARGSEKLPAVLLIGYGFRQSGNKSPDALGELKCSFFKIVQRPGHLNTDNVDLTKNAISVWEPQRKTLIQTHALKSRSKRPL